MKRICVVGVELGQSVMHLHAVDERGRKLWTKKLSRAKFMRFMDGLAQCVVGREMSRGSHHWGRELQCSRPRGPFGAPALRQGVREDEQERRGRCRGDL